MAKYPKDEFDDLRPTERKGAHRKSTGPQSQMGAIALISVLAIAAVLVLFGAFNIIKSSAGDPEAAVASGEPTATETATAEPTEDPGAEVEKTATVDVFNASGVSGSGANFAAAITSNGWTTGEVGNYESADTESTIYYHSADLQAQAEALAEELGVPKTVQSEEFAGDLTLVICSDIADSAPTGSSDPTDAADTDTTDGATDVEG